MKILRLNFKNLNSLRGQWSIDFADPAYINNGIFLISGPTGSGKTTILDAISLALFGRTPRLSSISTKTNEIMSRSCFECSAELEFEVDSGIYRISWMQRRANSKSDGKLQKPKHELVNHETSEVLATKIREVNEKVEQLLGMDYRRFTRSILLAQGAFNSFLQADEADKSDILEQITGTEVYSEISIKAHEKLREQKQSLNEKLQQFEKFELLSNEDLDALKHQVKQIELESNDLERNKQELNTKISSIKSFRNLEQRKESCLKDIRDLNEQQTQDEVKRELFELAKKSRFVSPLYHEYLREEEEVVRLRSQIDTAIRRLEQFKQESSKVTSTQKLLKDQLDLLRKEKLAQEAIWERVEIIDKQIDQHSLNLQNRTEQLNKKQAKLDELQSKRDQERERQRLVESQIQENSVELKRFEDLSIFFENMDRFRMIYTQISVDEAEFKRLLEEKSEEHTRLKVLLKDLDALNTQNIKAMTLIHDLESKKSLVFERLESLGLFKVSMEKVTDESFFESCSSKVQVFIHTCREYFALDSGLMEKQRKLEELNLNCELARNSITQIEIDLKTLEEAHERQKEQMFLTQLRQQLKEGMPCSLCGSSSHHIEDLYVSENTYDMNALPLARKKLESQFDKLEGFRHEISSLKATLSILSERKSVLLTSLGSLQSELFGYFIEFETQDFEPNFSQILLESIEKRFLEAAKHVRDWREYRLQLEVARRELENLCIRKEAIDSSANELRSRLASKEAQLAICSQRIKQSKDCLLSEVGEDLSSYDLLSIEKEHKVYLSKQKVGMELLASLEALAGKSKIYELEYNSLRSDIDQVFRELTRFEEEKSQMLEQRFSLFEGKDLKEEKQRFNYQLELAEQAFVKSNLDSTRLFEKVTAEESLLDQLRIEEPLKLSAAKLAKEKLEDCISSNGFNDKDDFKKYCLNDEDFDFYDEYFRNQDELRKKFNYELKLIDEQISQLALPEDLGIEQLEEQYQSLNDSSRELSISKGAIVERLRVQEDLREKQKSLLALIEKEKYALQKWQQLNEMIGSSDGRKYRVFAQSLTFERMLKIANTQLMQMTDRYLLTQNPESRLSLEVIDSYQGGVRRCVKNLSGGEGFIVSLALALALSRMSSKRTRMDSLFLDEGFGTLDEKALNMALEALSSLSMEGKLVGLISHVSSLKENIPIQILVEPSSTTGRSQIKGPGCKSGP